MPSAPAAAASQRPEFGLGCAAPSRRQTRSAPPAEPPTSGATATVSAAVSLAGSQLATSSARADAQPNRRYRSDRYPTIASRVFTAR